MNILLDQNALSGAELKSADLYGANLSGANLSQANLRGADLSGMLNLAGAVLHDVDFTGCIADKGLINFDAADIRNVMGLPALHKPNKYVDELRTFSEAVNQQFKIHNLPADELKPIEESMRELVKEVEDVQEPENISEVKKNDFNMRFSKLTDNVIRALPLSVEPQDIFETLFEPLLQTSFIKLIEERQAIYLELKITAGILQKRIGAAAPWYNKGNFLSELKKYNEAINCYGKAIEIYPHFSEAWYNKGNALKMLGYEEEAKASFARARELGYRE